MQSSLFHLFSATTLSFFICLTITMVCRPLSLSQARQIHWIHNGKALRLGGLAIVASILLFWAVFTYDHELLLVYILASSAPAFFMGFLEDVGLSVRPSTRLIASFVSAILAIILLSAWVTSIRLPFVDQLIQWPIMGISLTVLLSVTLMQSYNIVDGLNGLSSGLGIIALIGIYILTDKQSNAEIASIALLCLGVLFGFWLLNSFFGSIFLGDSGAYFIGHLVCWLSILLTQKQPEVTPWALLLGTAYPAGEVMVTVIRRLKSKVHILEPDKGHLHHKLKKWVERLGLAGPALSNSVASLLILLVCSFFMLLGTQNAGSTKFCAIATLFLLLLFFALSIFLDHDD